MDPQSITDVKRRGAVGVIWREDKLLVIRRALTIRAPGKFCFPGGGIEEGESEEGAVVRELQEEVNAIVKPIRCVWRNMTYWGVDLAWWLAELSPDAVLQANPDEVDSIHWLTPAEMLELPQLLESNREFLKVAARGEITIR
jgi:8-oxo-dGTP pyrophosphatase MutT (NUDIX family)